MGLGNVLIRYEYEPFMQAFGIQVTDELCSWDTQWIDDEHAFQVIDFVNQLIKDKK
jgi:hypothetical protein